LSVPPAFLASEYPPAAPQNALFHVIPVPLERGVSYGTGCARGPAAILEASQQLEAWDGLSRPGERGIHTAPEIDCRGETETVFARIENSVRAALRCNALPLLLGGEHTLTFGALRALRKHHGLFGIVQIDAHADLRAEYQGSPWSHACVMHRAVRDLGLPLAQFGVRELSLEEVRVRREFNVRFLDAPALMQGELPEKLLPDAFPEAVYLSFDVDGLDASLMPATGTPSPGGLGWYEALHIVQNCLRGRRVLGFDLTEFAPLPGMRAPDYTAAKLVYHIMGIVERNAEMP
jgi:agmatinase